MIGGSADPERATAEVDLTNESDEDDSQVTTMCIKVDYNCDNSTITNKLDEVYTWCSFQVR